MGSIPAQSEVSHFSTTANAKVPPYHFFLENDYFAADLISNVFQEFFFTRGRPINLSHPRLLSLTWTIFIPVINQIPALING